uniref:Rondonin n=1 Tax=Acanthoscurria rondoniae TaxID=1211104 RepID=RDNIN_ACARO|nr:RecName: Full=Rondonin [Acanthoscurria rondoniae]
IIIQYEGHKH